MRKLLLLGVWLSSIIILRAEGAPSQQQTALQGILDGAESQSQRKLMERVLAPYRNEILQDFMDIPLRSDLSDDPDAVDFYLYTNKNDENDFDKLNYNDESTLRRARWISGAPIKVLMHGFTQSQNSSFPGMLKNAYLERMRNTSDQYNVVVVDWGRLAGSIKSTILPIYTRAVRNVEVAGKRVGELIYRLQQLGIISNFQNVHLIGFSLGAHVAGQAGVTAYELNGYIEKVKRVSGLDPAGPLFYLNIPIDGRKLKSSDGQTVDILHTSWGSYGIGEDIGQADFHVNANTIPIQTQPECLRILESKMPLQVCSHNYAPVFYSMSILLQMDACQCKNYPEYLSKCRRRCTPTGTFGEDWDPTQLENYYMEIPKRIMLLRQSPGNEHQPNVNFPNNDHHYLNTEQRVNDRDWIKSEENSSKNEVRSSKTIRRNQLSSQNKNSLRQVESTNDSSEEDFWSYIFNWFNRS